MEAVDVVGIGNSTEIMDRAVETAGELLTAKPRVAEIILKQLLKCDPEHASGLQLLGLCKHRMGDNAEAIEIIQTALDLDSTNADNWNNIGLAYGALGEYKKAIECITKALELKPDQFLFINNLALQYKCLLDYDNAIKCMEKAIAVSPKPQLWLNLGNIYGEMKEIKKAEGCYLKSLELDPEYSAGHVNLAFSYHLQGDWKRGFAEYESRFDYYPQMAYYKEAYDMSKVWDGKTDLSGKRVLIYGEQGLGDIIQFSRYCKNLAGAHVIVHCPPNLEKVISRVDGVDEVNVRDIVNNTGPEFPAYDYQFSIMSFPHLLKLDKIDGSPYISAVTDKFRGCLKEDYGDSFNIGVAWAGSPSHPHDKKRSIPLKHFRGIYNTPNVRLFSLQLDVSRRQYGVSYRSADNNNTSALNEKFQAEQGVIDYCEGCDDLKLVDLTKMIQSFDDTATILNGLDLLICCDTAVAHLAGAMGIPVWVCLPFNTDWRWTTQGDTTPWYDSMRLFRQEERDNWEPVFEEVQKALNAHLLQNK